MDFAFTDEQEALRRTVRDFLGDRLPESALGRWADGDAGYDRDLWRQLAMDLGLPGLAIPERHGGAGAGFLELAVVFEEMGRVLAPTPMLGTAALATTLLLASDDSPASQRLLPVIAAGEVTATLAHAESDDAYAEVIATTATETASGWQVTGAKDYVIDGDSADALIVSARTGENLRLFIVEGAEGVRRQRLEALDPTRPLARVTFDAAPAELLAGAADASDMLQQGLAVAAVAMACEQVGGAQRCLEMATEHAKTRMQFDRLIGSFQAVKHACANMLVDVESAKSAAYYAAWCADQGNDELFAMASLARAYCSEVFTKAADTNIHLHGGMGFTWEHRAHLFLRRAKSSELLFGDPSSHRERLAELMGI